MAPLLMPVSISRESEVVDPNGAGDTVAATFTLALAAGAAMPIAAYLGNLAGGVSITNLLAPPLFASPTLGLGGALPAGAYYYVITATTATGETGVTGTGIRTIPGIVVIVVTDGTIVAITGVMAAASTATMTETTATSSP